MKSYSVAFHYIRVHARYMDRLALPSSELHLYVTPLTAHRLFTASLIIAIKFVAEKPPSVFNDRYSSRQGYEIFSLLTVHPDHFYFILFCPRSLGVRRDKARSIVSNIFFTTMRLDNFL